MPRPPHCRRIAGMPNCRVFKPQGIPRSVLEEVTLTEDEWEAIRLGDLEGMYQEQAAAQMNVSRQTFGRILESAHKKIADAIVNGKSLLIEGGAVEVQPPGRCGGPGRGRGRGMGRRCGHGWHGGREEPGR